METTKLATNVVENKESIREMANKVAAGIANAVLVMLGIGLFCETLGKFMNWQAFVGIETIAKSMLAPVLGAGVAYQLKGNTIVIFSAMIASTVGANAVHFLLLALHSYLDNL